MYCSATQNRKDGYTLPTPRISHVKVIACHLPARSLGVRSAEGMLALPSLDISAGLQDLLFFFLLPLCITTPMWSKWAWHAHLLQWATRCRRLPSSWVRLHVLLSTHWGIIQFAQYRHGCMIGGCDTRQLAGTAVILFCGSLSIFLVSCQL